MEGTRRRVAELIDQGLTPAEIAVRLSLARNTVYYHLRRMREEIETSVGSREPVTAALLERARSAVATRHDVHRLLEQGLSRAEAARCLGLSKSTVSYHARRLGAEIDGRCARRYDWQAVQAFYDEGHSFADCLRTFGFSRQSWQAAKLRGELRTRPLAMPLSQLLTTGRYRGRTNIKRRLLLEGLKEPLCEGCGISAWRGHPISLDLHHLNGQRNDNRLQNLQLLCPNCHHQADTELRARHVA